MAVIAEYRCDACGAVTERWMPSPPPAAAACPCGGDAQRRYGFSVGGRVSAPVAPAANPAATGCTRNPDVPLLCHVDPSAAPGWVARYRGDNRALDQHLERVETSPAPPTPPKPVHGHHHHHDHGAATPS